MSFIWRLTKHINSMLVIVSNCRSRRMLTLSIHRHLHHRDCIYCHIMWKEWQCKSENWDVERCSLQQQIKSLRTQNQILADKCDVIAETSSDLRSQLERRREKLDGTEQSLKVQVTQLSTLLERSKDTISSQVWTLLLWAEAVELCWHLTCCSCLWTVCIL